MGHQRYSIVHHCFLFVLVTTAVESHDDGDDVHVRYALRSSKDKLRCWRIGLIGQAEVRFSRCPGINADWNPSQEFYLNRHAPTTLRYHFEVNSSFFNWAYGQGLFDNAGPVGFKNAAEAQQWCLTTECPKDTVNVTAKNCCLYHSFMLICRLESGSDCNPWFPRTPSYLVALYVPIRPISERNWTADVPHSAVAGDEVNDVTVVAGFKVAGLLVALKASFGHSSDCGNQKCENEETCWSCEEDCGACSPTDLYTLITLLAGFSIVLTLIIFMIWRRNRTIGMFNESWIINSSEIFANVTTTPSRYSLTGMCTIERSSSKNAIANPLRRHSNMRRKHIMELDKGLGLALIKGQMVAVKRYHNDRFLLTPEIRKEVFVVRQLNHPNVCRFVAGTVTPGRIYIMFEYCPKGSLLDVLQNEMFTLNWAFRFSMLADVVCGMVYLHKHRVVHGNLKTTNCVVDDRWICKVTDYDLQNYRREEFPSDDEDEIRMYTKGKLNRDKVYRAPEADISLRRASDVFSFGIIMMDVAAQERVSAKAIREESDLNKMKEDLRNLLETKAQRVKLYPQSGMPDDSLEMPQGWGKLDQNFSSKYLDLVATCLACKAVDRPSFVEVEELLNRIHRRKTNPVDTMMALMQMYSKNLEKIVERRSRQLLEEKQKTESLLYTILPREVADDLRNGRQVPAESFENSTVFFSDIVSFTVLSSKSTPMQIVAMLNSLYTIFDSIIGKYDVYKVETIGDAYMVVSGVPHRTKDHATNVALMALDIMQGVTHFVIPHMLTERISIKVGMHSGPVCAGVVGVTMPRYCLFGDTVNTASRMESYSESNRIHVSNTCYDELEPTDLFTLSPRGPVDVKGKGIMSTYWLTGMKGATEAVIDISQISNPQSGSSNILANAFTN